MAGTKVLMRMPDDADLPLLDELAATGTMTAETDETAVIAVAALAVGVGVAVAKDQATRKERLKKRPLTRRNKRRGLTDGEDAEATNEVETASDDAGGMIVSEDNADAQTSNHESPAPGRRWLSGALTSLMLICFALSGWLWTQTPRQNQTVAVAAELPQHRADKGNETKNIEDVRLGERVVGRNPLREQTQSPSDIRPETHRTVRLEMNQHGTMFDLAFLRSLTWLDEQQAQVGGMIHLVMTELGLDGPARVVSIDPCPEIEADDGTGRMVVTGTMKHLASNVLKIQTDGDAEPLGVTDTHPIWSVDRQDFVVAGQLEIGESLEQADGTVTQITRITPTRGPPVMVYNLEIDGEHVFHVGDDGILVHNSCSDPHGYAIFNKHTGEIVKFGVSRAKNGITAAGNSKRALSHLAKIAAKRGGTVKDFEAILLWRFKNVKDMWKWERETIGRFGKQGLGHRLPGNIYLQNSPNPFNP